MRTRGEWTDREVMLRNLVGMAHMTAAKEMARKYAAEFKQPLYIFRTWKRQGNAGGLMVEIIPPTMGDYWRVSPDGSIEHVKTGS